MIRMFAMELCAALKTTCPIAPFLSPFMDTLRTLSGVDAESQSSLARTA